METPRIPEVGLPLLRSPVLCDIRDTLGFFHIPPGEKALRYEDCPSIILLSCNIIVSRIFLTGIENVSHHPFPDVGIILFPYKLD